MRDTTRSFVLDLSEPTGLLYLNGAIMNSARAGWNFFRRAPALVRETAKTPGCIQVKSAVVAPREFVVYSYWEDESALRRLYTHPRHVELMKLVFDHPDWYTLYNETYALPVSARYWNAANGYALTQQARPETMPDFLSRTGAGHVTGQATRD